MNEKKVTEVKVEKKSFIKKHWKKLALAGGLIITAAGIVIFRKRSSKKIDIDFNIPGRVLSDAERYIDEDICCDLLPELEDAILTRGITETYLTRPYDLGDEKKIVEIFVRKADDILED